MRHAMFLVMTALLFQGCSGGSSSELLASAKDKILKKDNKTAITELKTVLQKSPESAEARFLLGKALLESGENTAAVLELTKAADLGYSKDRTLPLLAKSLLLQNDHKKIIEQYSNVELTEPAATASLRTSVAVALLRQGQREKAEAALHEALRADPKFAPARVWQSIFKASRGDSDGALKILEEVIALEPSNREAWQAKGELLLTSKSDPKGATAAFKKAIEIDEKYLPAYSALITSALVNRDVPAMIEYVKELKRVLPKNPQTKYFEAQSAYLKQDFGVAREISLQLLKFAPDSVRLLQLAGAIEFGARSTARAEAYLSKAVALDPAYSPARRLLAKTYLRSGQPEKALSTLKLLLAAPDDDVDALATAAEASLHLGDAQKAEAYFARAAKANPEDPRFKTSLALLNLTKGNTEAAFKELDAVVAVDKGVYADMALISARLRRKEYGAALTAIDRMEKKQPKQAFTANLRGQVLLAQKDLAGARSSFEMALSIDPVYYPAVAELASLDVAEKAPDKARARLETLLRSDPKNARALLAMAELRVAEGAKSDEIELLVRRAVSASPTDPAPRQALVRYYMVKHDTKAALSEAQAGVVALPGNLDLLDALGQAQIAAGDIQQAVITFKKVTIAMPGSPQPHMRLANLYLTAKDYKASAASLNKALELAPGYLQAYRGLIHLALKERHFDEALRIAKKVQGERPKDEVGFILEGDIEAKRANWDAAIAAYRLGSQRVRTSEVGAKIHKMMVEAGRLQDAERFATTWEKDRPDDVAFLFYLGDQYLAKGEFGAAEAKYRAVSKLRANHALALNNTAFVVLKQGKAGSLELAAKANELAPNIPEFMDTLALAWLAEKQPAKAVEVQRRAVQLNTANNGFRLTLAKALLQAGDKQGAKLELVRLVALGSRFAGSGEAESLLRSL